MSAIKAGMVRVDDVLFHPHNVRRDLGDLRSLAASIKRFGILQPVVVECYGDRLRLRAGHRRLAAARIAGLTRIPAVIHDEALDDDEWLMSSAHENAQRRNLDTDERRRLVIALRDNGCSWVGIAEAFSVSPETCRVWAGDLVKGHQATRGPNIKCSTLRSFVAAWQDSDSATDVLAALARMAESGRLADALPQPILALEATA